MKELQAINIKLSSDVEGNEEQILALETKLHAQQPKKSSNPKAGWFPPKPSNALSPTQLTELGGVLQQITTLDADANRQIDGLIQGVIGLQEANAVLQVAQTE